MLVDTDNATEQAAAAADDSSLESATQQTYDELTRAYEYFNRELFGGALPGCLITLQRKKNSCGYYSRKRFGRADGVMVDEIAMNPSVFAVRPVEAVLSTLVHEQCHQWQEHFGKPGRRGYHNAEWAEKMEEVGLIPSATGRPGGKKSGEHMSHYIDRDGRFYAAVRALLETGFGLSWYDRFPISESLPIYLGSKDEDATSSAQQDSLDLDPNTGMIDSDVSGNVADADGNPTVSQSGVLSLAPRAGLNIEPTPPATRNNSNRLKFICPGCNDAAWGKPSLHLICGKCSIKMLAGGVEQ